MKTLTRPFTSMSTDSSEEDTVAPSLAAIIERAGHLLPAQGPITVFIHHNTLHAFEDLPFHQAVQKGGEVFGCEPYLSEIRFRQELAKGRIRGADLEAVLSDDLGNAGAERIDGLCSRYDLRLAMLQFPLWEAPDAELNWFIAQTDALNRFRPEVPLNQRSQYIKETQHWVMRDLRGGSESGVFPKFDLRQAALRESLGQLLASFGETSLERWSDSTWEAFTLQALWMVCRDGVAGISFSTQRAPRPVRHRDWLLAAGGDDSDLLVHDVLIRFCASFLDQGFSHWPLPNRQLGFYRAFLELYRQSAAPPDVWLSRLKHELDRLDRAGFTPLQTIAESLRILGVDAEEREAYVTASLLALRGWAGMIRQVEQRGDRVAHPVPEGSLIEFLAVRLILERLALSHVARESLEYFGPLSDLRSFAAKRCKKPEATSINRRALKIFELAQISGWAPATLLRMSQDHWTHLAEEMEAFSSLERRRVFHLAFERRYRTQTLDALACHARRPSNRPAHPRFQVVTCLDEREESFRRHLEEVAPECETFSAAGFFSVAMYFRGAADAHYVPLCPIVIRPDHWVAEEPVFTLDKEHRKQARRRRWLGSLMHQFHVGSRTFTGGALLATCVGALATIPLVGRVLFPRLTSRIRRLAGQFVQAPEMTQLQLERSQPTPGPEEGELGFNVQEMGNIAERLLRDIGMTDGFAPLVALLGHGSNSVNNPHKSAYDCGACGGNAGGANARAAAQILNDPRVREFLRARGLEVPPETVFVGGFHNTCNDSVTFYNLDRLPRTHQAEFRELQAKIEQTCDRNAHERCRRFLSAPLEMSFAAARLHVEARAEDLAQTRPECGHASNAVCFVGRRQRTRGLFMDRRTFLTSYDPTADGDRSILTRILQAAFPVCAGINLEYYFSYVDPAGWGCGTKLPHNVTALLGIMDGAASDLRPGLPWQMVEIHEPVRLLFVIENTPDAMLDIFEKQPSLGNLCKNGWIQLATLSPDSGQIHHYVDGRFEAYRPENAELPAAAASVDWYRGWRDHLGYAEIG